MRQNNGFIFLAGAILASVAWFNLAPIIPPPGATGSTGPQGSPGISGSPGPQGSPGPAATGGVIGTARLSISDPTVTIQGGQGILGSGASATFDGTGVYTVTPAAGLPDEDRKYTVTVVIEGTSPRLSTVTNGASSFVIQLFDPAGGAPLDPISTILISIQTLSQ